MSTVTAVASRQIGGSTEGPRLFSEGPPRVFHEVSGAVSPEKMEVVAEIFNRILEPLYGPQAKAISQIEASSDRKCFLLYEGPVPRAVLVFKTVLSSEFAEFGVDDSIEVKSLFVDHSQQNSGRGLGSALVNKLKQEVEKLGLPHKGIHVTVSETKQESLMFFRKKGFEVVHTWDGRYIEGVKEHLLQLPRKIVSMEQARVQQLETATAQLSLQRRKKASAATETAVARRQYPKGVLRVINGAHLDDIHCLKLLADGTFISGSKDNSIIKWSSTGKLIKVVDDVEPTQRGAKESNWVTAIEPVNDEFFVSGDRSGRVALWTTGGDFVKNISMKLPGHGHISRRLNQRRVNCITRGGKADSPTLLVGFPTMFDEFSLVAGRTTSSTPVHKNDWVYDIKPLDDTHALTVVGCVVDLWQKHAHGWRCQDTVLGELPRVKVKSPRGKVRTQRLFISAAQPLINKTDLVALSIFDGSVRVLDINRKTVVKTWKEHRGRVWGIENIAENIFASSGEDKKVKIWDLRQAKSIHTLRDHVGGVNSMLNLDERTFLASTCPDRPIQTRRGADIIFYDKRMFPAS
jgi:WD40 repeat protein